MYIYLSCISIYYVYLFIIKLFVNIFISLKIYYLVFYNLTVLKLASYKNKIITWGSKINILKQFLYPILYYKILPISFYMQNNLENMKDNKDDLDNMKDNLENNNDNNGDNLENNKKDNNININNIVNNNINIVATNNSTANPSVHQEVFLRVYDLSGGMAKVFSESLIGFKVDGIWHTSIEIFGNEYYFQNGLLVQPAGSTHYGQVVERISLGYTNCSQEELAEFFECSKETWTPATYNLFDNNCNNFSDWLANFLVGTSIPAHILELPEKVKASPFYQRMFGAKK